MRERDPRAGSNLSPLRGSGSEGEGRGGWVGVALHGFRGEAPLHPRLHAGVPFGTLGGKKSGELAAELATAVARSKEGRAASPIATYLNKLE